MGRHFSVMKPTFLSTVHVKLIGNLLDIFMYYNLDGGRSECFLFQGGVTLVSYG